MAMVMMAPVMLVLVGCLVVVAVVVVVALVDVVAEDVLHVFVVRCQVEFALPLLRLCRERIGSLLLLPCEGLR